MDSERDSRRRAAHRCGVIGDEEKLQAEPLLAIEGVEQVVPILKPFKLASREFHRDDSVIEVTGVKIGAGPDTSMVPFTQLPA